MDTPCKIWTGPLDKDGYGKVGRNYKTLYAHRYFYEQKNGPIPKGLQLDHLCRNRACVNPDHLEAVSQAENSRRGSFVKLTYAKVEQIRKMYETGKHRQVYLAELFGVGQDQISRIVNNKRWRVAS